MKTFDLYGLRSFNSIDDARSLIEQLLQLEMHAHESSYHCGDYFRAGTDAEENVILQGNLEEVENEWMEPNFQEFELLLYINRTTRPEFFKARLDLDERVAFLRREA